MTDRAMQALYLLGLDPIEEAQADANSYGFRLRRSCADALVQCHRLLCKRNSPRWVLEGDIRACFDLTPSQRLKANIQQPKRYR